MPYQEKPVIFVDRDGVINRDSSAYVKDWSEFEFLPGSLEALVRLTQQHFQIIIITNQSALNRGLMTAAALDHMHRMLRESVTQAGGALADILFCPHTPEEHCTCRKPAPGLVLEACRRYGLRAADTLMIGDSARDIECARRAGCSRAILVLTGNGRAAAAALTASNRLPDVICADLAAAAAWILKQGNRPDDNLQERGTCGCAG